MLIEWKFEHKAILKHCSDRGLMNPYDAFRSHKNSAKHRGIDFLLTFDEWWDIWKEVYHLRGTGTNGLCMARNNDTGPYSVDNVYITTTLGNLLDYHESERGKAVRESIRAKNYEKKKHKTPWCKKVEGMPHLVMDRKVYYEEPID